MRIAYISLHWPRYSTSSIGKKISLQLKTWQSSGHEVELFTHMHSVDQQKDLIGGKIFIYEKETGIAGFLRTETNRIKAVKQLNHAVEQFQPEVIYLRWAMYVLPIHRLSRIAPVVLEINTLDIKEHRLLGWVMNLYNRLTRRLTIKSAAGIVFTSRELARNHSFTKFRKPYVVIPNGIELEKTPFYPAPENERPRLVFIGTPGMMWQGADKLADFASRFPDIHIDLVGFANKDGFTNLPNNITTYPFLVGCEFEEVLSAADAAIGTMALHRKGMEEASPLKIRDCLARGIPCVLPYRDTAIGNLTIDEILQIPNTPDNISSHGNAIHDFVLSIRGKRIDREIIQERISSKVLESKRLDFIKKTAGGLR